MHTCKKAWTCLLDAAPVTTTSACFCVHTLSVCELQVIQQRTERLLRKDQNLEPAKAKEKAEEDLKQLRMKIIADGSKQITDVTSRVSFRFFL